MKPRESTMIPQNELQNIPELLLQFRDIKTNHAEFFHENIKEQLRIGLNVQSGAVFLQQQGKFPGLSGR